jgi:hypothetical protein
MLSDNLKKRIAIKNLDNSYQGRQASIKNRNLIFKFEDFQLFLKPVVNVIKSNFIILGHNYQQNFNLARIIIKCKPKTGEQTITLDLNLILLKIM